MSDAAIQYEPEDRAAALLTGWKAWEAFTRGMAAHRTVEALRMWRPSGRRETASWLQADVARPVEWIFGRDLRRLRQIGAAHLPGASLTREAWLRRPIGPASYALSGLVADLSTSSALERLADLAAAPLEPWDALVFTSDALRRSYEHQGDALRGDLSARFGATRFPDPLTAVIPMAVDVAAFSSPAGLRAAERRRLALGEDTVAVLHMAPPGAGGSDLALMGAALQLAAERTRLEVVWLLGSEEAPSIAGSVRTAWPKVTVKPVALKTELSRLSLWSAADLYLDLTTGLGSAPDPAPLEALASGLPVVLSDWGPLRELVRHGEDGFRVRTHAPRGGLGRDLAFQNAAGMLDDAALRTTAGRMTAVDLADAATALTRLVVDGDLRRRMGKAARHHAAESFDWPAVLTRYRELWAQQAVRRQAALRANGGPPSGQDPRQPDPFAVFAAYPTVAISPSTRIALRPGATWGQAHSKLSDDAPGGPLPTLEEAEQVFQVLARAGVSTVGEVATPFGARAGVIERGLTWLARHDVVTVIGSKD